MVQCMHFVCDVGGHIIFTMLMSIVSVGKNGSSVFRPGLVIFVHVLNGNDARGNSGEFCHLNKNAT